MSPVIWLIKGKWNPETNEVREKYIKIRAQNALSPKVPYVKKQKQR